MRLGGSRGARGNQWRALALAALLVGCGGDESTAPGSEVAGVDVEPKAGLLTAVGATLTVQARVTDGRGRPLSGVPVSWSSSAPGVATVDGSGVVSAVNPGKATVTATVEGLAAAASVEVWIPPEVTAWVPGTSYYGRERYVEYVPGELPVVISAPHGGSLIPAEIPDRTVGTTVTDSNTRETLAAVRQALIDATGKAPHVVVSHLRRTKLDPNREIVEAAQGSPFAEHAWREFQGFIEVATAEVGATFGSGLYIDLHGHGHAIARAELGYLLSAAQLNGSDASLDQGTALAQSSIRALAQVSPLPFSSLLRGERSLGGYLQKEGVRSVPSPSDPGPGQNDYFTGGYNTQRHGSQAPGRTVSGVQIELPLPGIRDTEANRQAFGRALAGAVEAFMVEHYGFFRTPR